MQIAHVSLIVATLLCSLTAGFVFAFATVVMPGIGRLGDREFIRAFQVVDGVIQDNQPLFVLVWVGSIVALVISVASGIGHFAGTDRWLLVVAAGAYLAGVQVPTFTINVPLNRALQALEVDALDEAKPRAARETFEPR